MHPFPLSHPTMTTAATPALDPALPRLIEGRTAKKGIDSRFWFGLAQNAAEGKQMVAELSAGFDTYLANRRIGKETLYAFDMVEAVLSPEDVAAEQDFIEKLAKLPRDEKFANFLDFIGKKDLTKKYKQRSKR